MTPDMQKFLELLHPGQGYRDIRAISSDRKVSKQFLFGVGEFAGIEKFLKSKHNKGLNAFVGVAARIHEHGGQVKDCGQLMCLFVDLDFKAIDEQKARTKIETFAFAPSMVVATGGGLHVYWLLEKPLDLQVDDPAYVKGVLRALATHLGADLGAATPERILRLPDTENVKYDPPRKVVLEAFHPDRRYDLAQIVATIGPILTARDNKKQQNYKRELKDEDRIKLAKKWLSSQEPAVQGQGGDQHTFNICCAVAIGYDLDEAHALDALKEWNARCSPPWSEDGLRTKLKNAEQYGEQHTRGSRLRKDPRALRHESLTDIKIRPVHWLWDKRLPLGSLCLLAGREGIGKSLLAYQLVADITTGRLEGKFFGTSRCVIIAATEDSFEHTIVPRLMAAGADLRKVYRVTAESAEGSDSPLILPKDVAALERMIEELDVALVLLDPIISRLDRKLDSHKDADVRIGLEPMSALANNTNAVVLGVIHVNKGSQTDPLNMVMGSRAFVAVARSTIFVMTDPEDQALRMVGTPKNNLGPIDLPTLLFSIENHFVAHTDEGDVFTGKLVWKGETTRTLTEEIETNASEDKVQVIESSEWLTDFLTSKGGFCDSNEIKKEAKKVGYNVSTLQRARKRIQASTVNRGTFPRATFWCLKGHQPPADDLIPQIDVPF